MESSDVDETVALGGTGEHPVHHSTRPTVMAAQVNLCCQDVERCARFFEALGTPRAFTWPAVGVPEKIEVDAGGFRIGFDSVEAANRIADLGATAGGPRSTDVALWVRDVDGLYEPPFSSAAHPFANR